MTAWYSVMVTVTILQPGIWKGRRGRHRSTLKRSGTMKSPGQYMAQGTGLDGAETAFAIACIFGAGLLALALATSAIWIPAVGIFLAAHPGIPASAFWAVVKALVKKKNPVKAGVAAGMDAAAVGVITGFVAEYMPFVPKPVRD